MLLVYIYMCVCRLERAKGSERGWEGEVGEMKGSKAQSRIQTSEFKLRRPVP